MVHTQVQGTLWQSAGHPLPGKDTSCIKETRVSGVRRPKAGPRGEPSHGRRRNLKVWVQSLRSCTGSTRGHSRWTGSSRVCSSWTGSRMTHNLKSKSRACSNCIGSSHKSHSHPWSPHRSHSWSRNRLCYLHRCCGFPVLLVCKPLSGDSTALCFSHTRSQSQRKTWCHWWEENNQNELRRTPVLCRSREENRRQVIRFSTRSSSKEEVATFRKNHGLLWLLWRLWLRLWGLWLQPLCVRLLLQTRVLLCASLFLLQLWLLWGLQGRLWFLWLLPVQLLQALLLPVQLLCPRVLPV
uniref:uncharacterized protein LOC100429866 isoform X3 n=1 Tax=Macaca mulatta TaxID=9544 RepID=UPI0010A28197|nr:uncharacterized protein LOC100429866 isoform X3 [Macaca mulatta]